MAHNSLFVYFLDYSLLQCQTRVQTVTVNNIEVTVNTCTCTDVFIIITTKNQSGGMYTSYSTGTRWPGIYGCIKQTLSTPSDSVCLLP